MICCFNVLKFILFIFILNYCFLMCFVELTSVFRQPTYEKIYTHIHLYSQLSVYLQSFIFWEGNSVRTQSNWAWRR